MASVFFENSERISENFSSRLRRRDGIRRELQFVDKVGANFADNTDDAARAMFPFVAGANH